VGPQYLTRFRCIADRCEDTCCSGLKVPVDAAGYGRMREALLADGMSPDELEAKVPLNPDRSDPEEQHAFIQMNPDGRCPFLDGRALCGLHARHGERVLSSACSMFPRAVTLYPDRREAAGSMACPEVVRLAILSDEPLDPLPLPAELLPRPFVNRTLVPDSGSAYAAGRDRVRAAVLRTLAQPRFPLGSRLLFLGQLGHWLRPFDHRGCATHDGAELDQRLTLLSERTLLTSLHRQFAALRVLTDKWIALFLSILEDRARTDDRPRYGALARAVVANYGGPHARRLSSRVRKAEAALSRRAARRLAHALPRYAMSWWYRNPHTDSDTLAAHAFKLAFRVAMVRTMILGHPEALKPRAGAMDAAVVEVIQIFSKHLELSPELQDWTSRLASAPDAEVFAGTAALAKLACPPR
jgi:lysine-N-methylase